MDFMSLTRLSIGSLPRVLSISTMTNKSLFFQRKELVVSSKADMKGVPTPVYTRRTRKKSTDIEFLLQFRRFLATSLQARVCKVNKYGCQFTHIKYLLDYTHNGLASILLWGEWRWLDAKKITIELWKNYSFNSMKLRYMHYPKSLWFWKV